MKYKLVVSARAEQDRDRAFEWYSANYSPEYAVRWYEVISKAMLSIVQNPQLCHRARENQSVSFDLYEVLFGKRRSKHRILFTLEDDAVVILHIRHSARRDLTEDDF
jgi:plasmid stabilization system protein ParE